MSVQRFHVTGINASIRRDYRRWREAGLTPEQASFIIWGYVRGLNVARSVLAVMHGEPQADIRPNRRGGDAA